MALIYVFGATVKNLWVGKEVESSDPLNCDGDAVVFGIDIYQYSYLMQIRISKLVSNPNSNITSNSFIMFIPNLNLRIY